jgi:chlorobactene glucosyltransferase
MSIWLFLWFGLAGVIGLVWIARVFVVAWMVRRRRVLDSHSYDGPPADPPRISVIVAAKDEQENIEACLTTLLEQDYPDFEVIAVDDRSRDRTPQILERLESAGGGRLRVLTVRSLREGWFGKNNAMREGVARSTGDWLCFTDADCWQVSRNTLSMAMQEALTRGCDFLSITPVLETRRFWERIIQPVCALVLIIWFLPEKVNNPKSKAAYANGAFMLLSRKCYEAIGGHESARSKLNEDIHMAQATKQMGLKLRVVENGDLYRTRMYGRFWEAWRGWSRIFHGSLGSPLRLFVALTLLIVFSLLPWISLVIAVIGWAAADAKSTIPWMSLALSWAGVIFVKQMVTWRLYNVLRIGGVWSLTYIAGCVIAFGMLMSAMFKSIGAGATTWRGTTYRGHRLVETTADTDRPVTDGLREPAGRV